MARGITETDVHTAADKLVAAGERPTVERIRAHLGTGSPNTVTRWLETWWQGLGGRLDAQHVRLSVPEAPETIAHLAGQWWSLALEAANAHFQASIEDDRCAVESERAALQQAREALNADAAAWRAQTETAHQAERLAVAQATELQRLVRQLEAHVEELTRQRDAATTREAELEGARQALQQRTQQQQASADAERENYLQHVRAVEDRANAEIDRARQETKDLQNRVATLVRTHAATEKASRHLLDQATAKSAEIQRELGAQRARAEALETQLGQLQDLSAAVEAAIRRAGSPPDQPKRREKLERPAPRKRSKITGSR